MSLSSIGGRLLLLPSLTRPRLNHSKALSNFHIKHLQFIPRSPRLPIPKELGAFGTQTTDHMLEIDYKDGAWGEPVIRPVEDLRLHPTAKVLHYSPTIFEGLKAFRGVDNEIRLFRAERNMNRMMASAERAALPKFCPVQLEHMIEDLVRKEQEWIPSSPASSLYIRPFLMGTDASLGVSTPQEAKLVVVCSPVGPYYPTGWKPITLYADPAFIRAAPGGVGAFKMGCNYAPTIAVADRAQRMGCHQVLWLYGKEQWITEAGTMNVFVVWKRPDGETELVTPPTSGGLILPGVTRDSILELANEWGDFHVSQRYPTMREVVVAAEEGRLLEVFGAGTAAVVAPVNRICYIEKEHHVPVVIDIPERKVEESFYGRFYKAITDIQYGRVDRSMWVRIVD